MARPEGMAFGLPIPSFSSKLMIAGMTSLEPSSPQSQWHHCRTHHCHSLSADGCSERVIEFSLPEYQLKPSDGRKLNSFIK